MKIYVVQYNCSMSPTGEIVAVRSSLPSAKKGAQESENVRMFPVLSGVEEPEPEILRWIPAGALGPWHADGFNGVYTISEWEVAP